MRVIDKTVWHLYRTQTTVSCTVHNAYVTHIRDIMNLNVTSVFLRSHYNHHSSYQALYGIELRVQLSTVNALVHKLGL